MDWSWVMCSCCARLGCWLSAGFSFLGGLACSGSVTSFLCYHYFSIIVNKIIITLTYPQ